MLQIGEHLVQIAGFEVARGELVLGGVVEKRERHLVAYPKHGKVGDDLAPVLDRTNRTVGAVAHEGNRLARPFGPEGVEGVFMVPGTEWLYSGVTKMNPSHASMASDQRVTASTS